MVFWGLLVGAALLLLLVKVFQKRYSVVQYLFFTRYALAAAAALVLFPIVSVSSKGMREFTENLFDLGPGQLGLISFLAIMISWAVALTLGVIYLSIPKRCDLPFDKTRRGQPNLLPAIPEWLGAIVAALPAASTIGVSFFRSPAELPARLIAVAIAVAAAAAFYAVWAKAGQPVAHRVTAKFLKSAAPPHPRLRLLNVSVFLALAGGTYLGFGIGGFPTRAAAGNYPPLAFVLLLLLLGCIVLNLLAYVLDVFRVPVLIVLGAASFFSITLGSDHRYDVRPWTAPVDKPLGPADAARAWLKTHPVENFPTVVFVAASGGGIKAATWTATVLSGLRQELGDDFARSILLVSSVSGGSVGSMYFLEGYQGGPPDVARAEESIAHASRSSLAAVGWGFAYPDFWRLVFSPIVPGAWDRGWALERRWRMELHDPEATFSSWREGIAAGWRPVPIFNATAVETGDRFTLSPIDVPEEEGKRIALARRKSDAPPARLDFRHLYKGKDLAIVTAARLSATFPYVSPVARPGDESIAEKDAFHVGDGGYFDNDGVVSALEFMEEALWELLEKPPAPPRRKAVLLRIRASPAPEPAGQGDEAAMTLAGPLVAMLNVRTASQTARNDVEVERFCESWRCMGIEVEEVNVVLDVRTAMSWHLTKDEIDRIAGAWRTIFADSATPSPATQNGRELRKLRGLFKSK